jgi:hypothetical protein
LVLLEWQKCLLSAVAVVEESALAAVVERVVFFIVQTNIFLLEL